MASCIEKCGGEKAVHHHCYPGYWLLGNAWEDNIFNGTLHLCLQAVKCLTCVVQAKCKPNPKTKHAQKVFLFTFMFYFVLFCFALFYLTCMLLHFCYFDLFR